MSNAQAYWWGIWSVVVAITLLFCISGNVIVDQIDLTIGWHRWAIGISCVLVLDVIIHSVFWGGTK